jgi:hypothetical protein
VRSGVDGKYLDLGHYAVEEKAGLASKTGYKALRQESAFNIIKAANEAGGYVPGKQGRKPNKATSTHAKQ